MLLLPAVGEEATPDQLSGRIALAQMLWFAGLALAGWLAASRRGLGGLGAGRGASSRCSRWHEAGRASTRAAGRPRRSRAA